MLGCSIRYSPSATFVHKCPELHNVLTPTACDVSDEGQPFDVQRQMRRLDFRGKTRAHKIIVFVCDSCNTTRASTGCHLLPLFPQALRHACSAQIIARRQRLHSCDLLQQCLSHCLSAQKSPHNVGRACVAHAHVCTRRLMQLGKRYASVATRTGTASTPDRSASSQHPNSRSSRSAPLQKLPRWMLGACACPPSTMVFACLGWKIYAHATRIRRCVAHQLTDRLGSSNS